MVSAVELRKLGEKLESLQQEHIKKRNRMKELDPNDSEYIELKLRIAKIVKEVDEISVALNKYLDES